MSGVLMTAAIGLGVATPVGARGAQTAPVSNAPMSGSFTVTAVSSADTPIQLVTGTDGSLWFLNEQSDLGTIASNGTATLTGITFPHASAPAQLVSAGPEGEWAFANGAAPGGGCMVALAEPGGHLLERILNHPVNPTCNGGARDRQGDLWVSLHGGPSSAMSEITPAGVVTPVRAPLTAARPMAVALGSDGAIWTIERAGDYGRFVPGGTATTVPIFGSATPPIPGSPFFGVPVTRASLLPRPDGTFWLVSRNAALSDPGQWFIRFLHDQALTQSVVTPDGALWDVAAPNIDGVSARMQRVDQWGVDDRSTALPSSPRNGDQLAATGSLAAQPDGSLWFVASDGGADFVVHYVPTLVPPDSVWTGSARDGKWSTPANWLDGAIPKNGSVVVLSGSGAMTDDIPGLQLQEIVDYGSIQLSGDAFSVGLDGIGVTGFEVNLVINDPITAPAGTSFALRADPPTDTLTVNGSISGSGGVTVEGPASTGSGVVILTAHNTYTGATTVGFGGELQVDGDQPASSVTVTAGGILTGAGTTGSVDNSGGILVDGEFAGGPCSVVLSVDGNLIFENDSEFDTAIAACGRPPVQAVGSILVSGSITIAPTAFMFLELSGDKPQVACLLSSQGSLHGHFQGVGEGSTEPDPSGGKVRFSYVTPGGSGCDSHALTATTGVH